MLGNNDETEWSVVLIKKPYKNSESVSSMIRAADILLKIGDQIECSDKVRIVSNALYMSMAGVLWSARSRPPDTIKSSVLLSDLYILCAYFYYVKDDPIVSDAYFDEMAKVLLGRNQKYVCIDKDSLSASTYLGEYPNHILRIAEIVNEYR